MPKADPIFSNFSSWPGCARKQEYPFFFFFLNRTYYELEHIPTRKELFPVSIASLYLSAHPVSSYSSARNHETTTDIDTWPHAPENNAPNSSNSLLYRAIDHRGLYRPLPDVEGCTRGDVTHLYSTFGGFASARHLKRSSLPSTMRPFLPSPDRILRDTFGA